MSRAGGVVDLLRAGFILLGASVWAQDVSVDAFRDGANHYRNKVRGADYARHAPNDVAAIADNILLHQRSNGGWNANWDPQRVIGDDEAAQIAAERDNTDTTFDNRATYTQVDYLAQAFRLTGDTRYRDGAVRGLEFMLKAQHPCGGFPHSYPSTANYRPYITFMDDVTAGTLTTLRDVATAAPHYDFVDDALRGRVAEAVERGTACVLRLQQPWQDAPAVWAGQYHHETLEPVAARTFEPPGFVCAESVGVVRYLMGIESPPPEVVQAIEGAVRWFEASQITGLRIERVDAAPVQYDHHTATHDVLAIPDPDAPPIWARFYEFGTNRPFMANRDGVKVYSLAEVHPERRTGYSWYGQYPARLLAEEVPAWRARVK